MGKGNIAIDKSMIKTIVDGKIIIPLPKFSMKVHEDIFLMYSLVPLFL